MSDLLLQIEDLSVGLKDNKDSNPLVNKLSFKVKRNQILGLVGESGAGKTLTMMAIANLLSQDLFWTSGTVDYIGTNNERLHLSELRMKKRRRETCRIMGIVLQDAMGSFNPYRKIGSQFVSTLRFRRKLTKQDAISETLEWIKRVGIHDAKSIMNTYPQQLSGGMRQRLAIALVMSYKPELILVDEPTTALDTINQMNVIHLMKDLATQTGTAMLYITHDLGVVAQLCDEVMVLRHGKKIEIGQVDTVYRKPQHPYTRSLLDQAQQILKPPTIK